MATIKVKCPQCSTEITLDVVVANIRSKPNDVVCDQCGKSFIVRGAVNTYRKE